MNEEEAKALQEASKATGRTVEALQALGGFLGDVFATLWGRVLRLNIATCYRRTDGAPVSSTQNPEWFFNNLLSEETPLST